MPILPPEILEQIFSYSIPQNYIFRIPTRETDASYAITSQSRGYPSHWGVPLLGNKEIGPLTPSQILSNPLNLLALLLSHSTISPHVITRLYSRNIFYFANKASAEHFSSRLSPLARSCITRIVIDTRGPARLHSSGGRESYQWPVDLDTSIPDILPLFPALKELRLGGIGPDLSPHREFTYRGRRLSRRIGEKPSWDCTYIDLVAQIVGVKVDADGNVTHSAASPETGGRSVWADAHVLCTNRIQWTVNTLDGVMRLNGTRIIRKGIGFVSGSKEEEVADVAEAVRDARRIKALLEA